MKPTVLITGAAGLLGSRLAQFLIETKKARVIGIDDMSGGLDSNLELYKHSDDAEFHRICLGYEGWSVAHNAPTLDEVIAVEGPSIIYHFAAYAAECLSPFIRRYNYKNNLLATAEVVNAAINYNVKRVVFTSSMAVYGRNTPPFSEDMPRNPIDPYGVAKAACEMDLEIAGEQHGLEYCILRPHNVYGPNQNLFDPFRNVIGIFMYKTLVGDPITIYGDGKQTRAFSYIDDTLEPMWDAGHLLMAQGEIINLGGIRESTIIEVAEAVRQQAQKRGLTPPDIIHLPARHEVRHAFSTYQKSVDLLDYHHVTDLVDGVGKMWDWVLDMYADAAYWERYSGPEYEVEKGLYPYWNKEALKDGYWRDHK